VIVAGSCVIEIGTAEAGLAESSLGNCAETPVPTCLPDASSATTLHWISLPPNGAVTDSCNGSERSVPPSLIVPVIGSRLNAPSISASSRQDLAVVGKVELRGSRETVITAA
jgi:hypothetical protein